MKNYMENYCRRFGIEQNKARFYYEGKRISSRCTPESLKMDDKEEEEEDKKVFFFLKVVH